MLSVTEVALVAGAVPSRTCGNVLYIAVGVCKQLVRKQAAGIALADGFEDGVAIDVAGSWA